MECTGKVEPIIPGTLVLGKRLNRNGMDKEYIHVVSTWGMEPRLPGRTLVGEGLM